MKIKISIIDNAGKIYEGKIDLSEGKNKNVKIKSKSTKPPYKQGSVSDRLVKLIDNGFFDDNKTVNDMIEELKSQDYHYKRSELDTPLRRIVRKGLLKRTKTLQDGTTSKKLTFVKV